MRLWACRAGVYPLEAINNGYDGEAAIGAAVPLNMLSKFYANALSEE